MVLNELSNSLKTAIKRLATAPYVDSKVIKDLTKELQRALLKADVNVKLVFELTHRLEQRALTEKPLKPLTSAEHTIRILYNELVNILGEGKQLKLGKSIVMLVGLYGQGKTTTCAKLAKYYQSKGLSVGIIASDVHRPAAYEQLNQLGEKINVPVYGLGKNAVDVVKHGLQEFKTKDIVLIDTSGRHSLEKVLIDEMKDIAKISQCDEKFLVIDATMGQQAKAQAQAFHESIGISGVILTKMDGSAKGGGALSAVKEVNAPIVFIGVGEKIEDFEHFDTKRFVSRLIGMGDIQTLLEKATQVIDTKKAEKLTKKLLSGKFTLKDMYEQMDAMSSMGPLQKILDLLPLGISGKVSNEQLESAQTKMRKFKVIMDSMVDDELENPDIVKGTRIKRISIGAGVQPKDVRTLLKYYTTTKNMLLRGGSRNIKKALMNMMGEMT